MIEIVHAHIAGLECRPLLPHSYEFFLIRRGVAILRGYHKCIWVLLHFPDTLVLRHLECNWDQRGAPPVPLLKIRTRTYVILTRVRPIQIKSNALAIQIIMQTLIITFPVLYFATAQTS